MTQVLTLLAAYLLGSIPFSYLVARGRGIDVRKVGSGNVGATNVMRSAGAGAGVLAFVLDFLKGAAASLMASRLDPTGPLPAAAAVVAVLGHMYPVWLGFKGGKGVATGAGVFLPMVPQATAAAFLAFGIALAATRYVSLASLVGTLTLASFTFALAAPAPIATAAVAVAGLIFWRHRSNIERLAHGTESRLGRPRHGSSASGGR